MTKAYFVYILRSMKNGRLYTGSTDNVDKRLGEHNEGHNAAARYTRPYSLLHVERFPSRIEAVQRERYLKTGKGRRDLEQILSSKTTFAGS
jgi:putative endonuclease